MSEIDPRDKIIEQLKAIIDNARMAYAETQSSDEVRCRAMAAALHEVDEVPVQLPADVVLMPREPTDELLYGMNRWTDEHKQDEDQGYSDSEMAELYALILGLAALSIQPAKLKAEPVLHFIVGFWADKWHYLTGPADLEILELNLAGWQKNTASACIVSTASPIHKGRRP